MKTDSVTLKEVPGLTWCRSSSKAGAQGPRGEKVTSVPPAPERPKRSWPRSLPVPAFPELPGAPQPRPRVVRGDERGYRGSPSNRAWGTGRKRCDKQKTQAFLCFSTFPCLFSFSQFLLKENFQVVLKTAKSSQNKLTVRLPAASRVHLIAPINVNLSE